MLNISYDFIALGCVDTADLGITLYVCVCFQRGE